MYDEVICNFDLHWAIAHNWSVSPVCKIAKIDGLDLSGITITNGDFNQTQLQAAIDKEANLHRIAVIAEREREGQTVVFCPSVASSKGVCHYLTNNYGVPATYVYGTMPDDERSEALRKFKSGEVQVLVNCQVVAVGFDHPPTATLILGRPTRSRSFWLQCVGRATRPLAGVVDFPGSTIESRGQAIAGSKKPRFKIVDCTDETLNHRLVTAVDMFVDESDEIKQVIKSASASSPEPLSQEDLDRLAQAELERRKIAAEIEARRKLLTGRAKGSIREEHVDLSADPSARVGTYYNPLKGKYAGLKMSQLPDHYIHWACGDKVKLNGWVRNVFVRERSRRFNERRPVNG
jgi:superfamily II DNA or RNA helicase